jgi:hypothetical protein
MEKEEENERKHSDNAYQVLRNPGKQECHSGIRLYRQRVPPR